MNWKLMLSILATTAVGICETGSLRPAVTAAALGISFIDGSRSAMILERDGHKYRIDLVDRTVLEVQAAQGGPAAQPPAGSRFADPPAGAPDGGAIFKQRCDRCHGADGKGKAAVGTPDFTNPKVQASLTNEEMIATITNGRKGTIMPAWKGKLSPQEISAVAAYLRSFGQGGEQGQTPSRAGETKPSGEYEPGDDFLLTLPTGRPLERHGFYINFAHRFALVPAFSGTARGDALLGLDGFSLSSFGFRYGVTDKLSVSAYRSPTFIARPIQFMAAYNLLSENRQYVNAAARISVQGENNFSRNFTPSFELVLSRSVTRRAQFYLVPTVSLFNRRLFQPGSYGSAAIPDRPGFHTFSVGAGGAVDVRPTVALLAEIIPTFVNATELGIHRPVYGFGIQKKLFRHAFTLGFTTGPGTTVAQRIGTRGAYLGGVPDQDKLFIGFDLTRQVY